MARLRIGTRGSALALAQTRLVIGALGEPADVVPISTRGDEARDIPLSQIGGKAVFAREIEAALLFGEIDVAVHSLKDLDAVDPEGLVLGAVLEREDARDVMAGSSLGSLRPGSSVGTSSARRTALMRALRPDLTVVPLRGNVDTRLEKISLGEADAAVLAGAGLARLGRLDAVTEWLDPVSFVPAPGQGAIGVQVRAGEEDRVAALNHAETRTAVDCERAVVRLLGGNCSMPLGAWARMEAGELVCDAFLASPDGSGEWRASARGADPEAVAASVVRDLEAAGYVADRT